MDKSTIRRLHICVLLNTGHRYSEGFGVLGKVKISLNAFTIYIRIILFASYTKVQIKHLFDVMIVKV